MELQVYLIDTNVVSELRKKTKANGGVIAFFNSAIEHNEALFISAISLGELRRRVAMIQHRGDKMQASILNAWLETIVNDYADNILSFSESEAQVWGVLRVPNHENALDKQIAATALTHDLILVTRNITDFSGTGVKLLNPFLNH